MTPNSPAGNHHRLPKLPQFGLWTMLVGVAACGGLFAVMNAVGALWSTALAWFLLLVAAHVSANVWGSRSRDRPAQTTSAACDESLAADVPSPLSFAPSTRLRRTAAFGRTMLVVTASGGVLGGTLGTYLLCVANWGRVGLAGIVVGGVSAAIIGGFLGFLASTFIEVASQAFGEARQELHPTGDE